MPLTATSRMVRLKQCRPTLAWPGGTSTLSTVCLRRMQHASSLSAASDGCSSSSRQQRLLLDARCGELAAAALRRGPHPAHVRLLGLTLRCTAWCTGCGRLLPADIAAALRPQRPWRAAVDASAVCVSGSTFSSAAWRPAYGRANECQSFFAPRPSPQPASTPAALCSHPQTHALAPHPPAAATALAAAPPSRPRRWCQSAGAARAARPPAARPDDSSGSTSTLSAKVPARVPGDGLHLGQLLQGTSRHYSQRATQGAAASPAR